MRTTAPQHPAPRHATSPHNTTTPHPTLDHGPGQGWTHHTSPRPTDRATDRATGRPPALRSYFWFKLQHFCLASPPPIPVWTSTPSWRLPFRTGPFRGTLSCELQVLRRPLASLERARAQMQILRRPLACQRCAQLVSAAGRPVMQRRAKLVRATGRPVIQILRRPLGCLRRVQLRLPLACLRLRRAQLRRPLACLRRAQLPRLRPAQLLRLI